MTSTILIVEDDADTAAFLRSGLGQAGYPVEVARVGLQGLAMARAIQPKDTVAPRPMAAAIRPIGSRCHSTACSTGSRRWRGSTAC